MTFEGQAAMWIEQLAASQILRDEYPFPFDGNELDFRPLLGAIVADRQRRRSVAEISRAFHRGVAAGLCRAVTQLAAHAGSDVVVLSGGVFQNAVLLDDIASIVDDRVTIWTNRDVPPNDGGISLGQAALAACALQRRS